MDQSEMDEMDLQELRENGIIKNQLKTATQDDFYLVVGDDPYPYAASLFGCYDIALFKRKADCERFIKTFPVNGAHG